MAGATALPVTIREAPTGKFQRNILEEELIRLFLRNSRFPPYYGEGGWLSRDNR